MRYPFLTMLRGVSEANVSAYTPDAGRHGAGRAKPLSQLTLALVAASAFAAVVLAPLPAFAQSMRQPCKLVDGPTAGVLPKGNYDLEFKFHSAGDISYGSGMITGIRVGITERFSLGLSYGGEGIIGRSNRVDWNPFPGVFLKYRIIEERYSFPAVALGFDNQGYGGIAHDWAFGYDGYIYKSPGFFAAMSKNFIMLGAVQVGFHSTVNYSLEGVNDVSWPNVVAGMDIGINEELAIAFEYDFAFNDLTGRNANDKYVRPFYGIMNIGLRWAFTPNFHMDLGFKDILENKMSRYYVGPVRNERSIGWSRELRIVYMADF